MESSAFGVSPTLTVWSLPFGSLLSLSGRTLMVTVLGSA